MSEANHKVQENRSIVHNNGLSFQHGKYTRDSNLIQGECQLSDGSLSPDRPYGETSLSVPLHPTKRPASNPPPISNQATKGNVYLCGIPARVRGKKKKKWLGKGACKHQKELLDAETEKRTDLDFEEKYKMGILRTLKFWHRMCGGRIKRDLIQRMARWNFHS